MINEMRMKELAEKFASRLADEMFSDDLLEFAKELDMTDDEVEYFGWESILDLDEIDDDYRYNMCCDTTGLCNGTNCPQFHNCKG